MKIIGIDVGGAYSTAFLLEGDRPSNIKDFVVSKDFTPFKVKHTEKDLQALIDLKPDLVVMEPTGFHYEALICNWLDKHGIEWRRAVGTRIAAYRKLAGLPKTDGRDALAIACFAAENVNDPSAFIYPCRLTGLRRLWIERDNLQRVRTSLVNRVKQQFHHEFPEVAKIELDRKWGDPCPALIRWMVDDPTLPAEFRSRYRNMHFAGRWKTPSNGKIKTTTGTIGTGLGRYSYLLAKQIYETDEMSRQHEEEMEAIINEPQFEIYMQAFNSLGFSKNMKAIWLTRIYPFDRFLGSDRRPIRRKKLSKNGKTVTYHVSLNRFKAALGAGLEPNTSGIRGEVETKYRHRRKKKKGEHEWSPMGDKLCRKAFVRWADKQLETNRLAERLDTPPVQKLSAKHKKLKEKGTKKYQRLGNLHGYACRILFSELAASHVKAEELETQVLAKSEFGQ